MPPSLRFLALTFYLLTAGCATGGSPEQTPGGTEPVGRAQVHVDNRSSLDMDIAAVRSDGQLIRLGLAPGNETTTFGLPPTVITGAAWIRFQGTPLRGAGETVVSEPYTVRTGEEITWSVSPQ